eukprot:131167_1
MSSSYTKPFTKSSKLPLCVNNYMSKPLYHPTHNNCIVITTFYANNKPAPGIYKYNTETNELQIIYKYNNTFKRGDFKPAGHGQFIDISNNTLILYGGDNYTFKIFDLNTNQMKQINDKNIISKCAESPQSTLIPS